MSKMFKVEGSGRRSCVVDFVMVVALLAISVIGASDPSKGVIVSGSYEYDVSERYHRRYDFEISLFGCSWIIAYEDPSALTDSNTLVARSVASCDGTNIYHVQFHSEPAVRKAWGDRYESIRADLPVAVANVFPGTYPPPRDFTLVHLWFAFGSGCVFNGSFGSNRPPSSVDLALFYEDPRFLSEYQWSTIDAKVGSREIAFKNNGYFARRDTGSRGKVVYSRYLPPFQNGFISARGVVSQATNCAGMTLPLKFDFTEFVPDYGVTNFKRLRPIYTYTCSVTNVGLVDGAPIPVALPEGRVDVSDIRFQSRGYAQVNYILTNGWIVDTNDEFLISRLQNSPKVSLEEEIIGLLDLGRHHGQWKRYLVWLFLALAICLLIFTGTWRKLKPQSHTQT
jgi:hypothetical protein